jgi:hypothetical protein
VRTDDSLSCTPQTSSRSLCLPPSLSASNRLDSWKEIAVYLKRTVRTVQRWEKTEGLPVHRHVHDHQGSVYAHRSQLDAWWASEPVSVGQVVGIDSGEICVLVSSTRLQKSPAQAQSAHPDVLPYKLITSADSNGRPLQIELILAGERTERGVSILRLVDISGNGSEWRAELNLGSLRCGFIRTARAKRRPGNSEVPCSESAILRSV